MLITDWLSPGMKSLRREVFKVDNQVEVVSLKVGDVDEEEEKRGESEKKRLQLKDGHIF